MKLIQCLEEYSNVVIIFFSNLIIPNSQKNIFPTFQIAVKVVTLVAMKVNKLVRWWSMSPTMFVYIEKYHSYYFIYWILVYFRPLKAVI